jgi:transcriptional regulator with XRE-family HTH domain
MLIQDRIKLIIKANNESPSSFADNIGIKRSNLSHVLSGRNKPSLDFLSKILNSYPSVNASWLVTGVTREGTLKEPEAESAIGSEPSVADPKAIERILIFYKDGTFKSYNPSEQ